MILYPDVQKQGKPVSLEGIWPPKSERERIFNIINGRYESDVELTAKDLDRFTTAKSDKHFKALLDEYSTPIQPLFGPETIEFNTEDVSEYDGVASISVCGVTDSTTIADCKNLSSLLRAGAMLCYLKSHEMTNAAKAGDYGLLYSTEKIENSIEFDFLTVEIPWIASAVSEAFVSTGIKKLPKARHGTTRFNFTAGCLEITAEAEVDKGLYLYERTRNIVSKLLDDLSMVMLNDMETFVDDARLVTIANSTASSLWAVLLDSANKGRTGLCEMCGAPFVAPSDRKNPKRFCSDRCRKRAERERKSTNA